MRWSQASSVLAVALVLAMLTDVAVGRTMSTRTGSLRAQSRDPSPAELEEQEEESQQEEVTQQTSHSAVQAVGFSSAEGIAPALAAAVPLNAEGASIPSLPLALAIVPVPADSTPRLQALLAEGVSGPMEPAVSTKPSPATVPPGGSSYGDAASAKALFPPSLPAFMASAALPNHHPKGWHGSVHTNSTETSEHSLCHPPCIQGRGVCNDNLCFCKSPYSGTTCQHKFSTLPRVPYVFVVAFCIVSVLLGLALSHYLMDLFARHVEKKTGLLEPGRMVKEVWYAPKPTKKGVPRGHAVESDRL